MKKLFFSIIVILVQASLIKISAQCTPDNNITTTGIYPLVLDSAEINQQYNQVIQFYITKDTAVTVSGTTLNATIDSLYITGVAGLPNGFTYACNNSVCGIKGGSAGCVAISGMAEAGSSGVYPLMVYIKIKARVQLGPVPVTQYANDSNGRYFIVVKGNVGIKDQLNQNIKAFVSNGQLHVLNAANNVMLQEINLINASGQQLLQSKVNSNNSFSLNLPDLNTGIYWLTIKTNLGFVTQKIWVEPK